jgi:hypothetical protein
LETEGATELKDVLGVLACRLVPKVTEHLHWCGDARDRHAAHLARDEALGRIAKRPTTRLRLNTASLRVESDRVEVELLALAAEHEPNREMIFVQSEAERLKDLVDERDVAERND